jgi:hypothetical protein
MIGAAFGSKMSEPSRNKEATAQKSSSKYTEMNASAKKYPHFSKKIGPFDKSTTTKKPQSIQLEPKFSEKNSTFIDEISFPEERSINYEPSEFCAKNINRINQANDYLQQQIRSISPDISMRSPYILVSDSTCKKNI